MGLFSKNDESSDEDKRLREQGMAIAEALLRGPGLNHMAFARDLLNKETPTNKDKSDTKELYDDIIEEVQARYGVTKLNITGGLTEPGIYKDGHDHFLAEEGIEHLKGIIKELEDENAKLRAQLTKAGEDPDEPRVWRYNHKTGKAAIFTESKARELEAVWKDHPRKK